MRRVLRCSARSSRASSRIWNSSIPARGGAGKGALSHHLDGAGRHLALPQSGSAVFHRRGRRSVQAGRRAWPCEAGAHGRGRHHPHDAGIRRAWRVGAPPGDARLSRAAEKVPLATYCRSAGDRTPGRFSWPWHAGAGGNRAPEAVPVSACRVEPQRKADRGRRLLSWRGSTCRAF